MSNTKTIDDFFEELDSLWLNLQVNRTRDKLIEFFELVEGALPLLAEVNSVYAAVVRTTVGTLNNRYFVIYSAGIFGRTLKVEPLDDIDGNPIVGIKIKAGLRYIGKPYLAEYYARDAQSGRSSVVSKIDLRKL